MSTTLYVRWWGNSVLTDEKIKNTLLGQITVYCEQVNTGTKLCAQVMCMDKYLSFIKAITKQERCKILYKNGGKGFKVVFIYKYDFVQLIINELFIKKNKKRIPSGLEIWASGKLFGYSDYEISNYLRKHGYLKKMF